jgi:hypothetical protein
MKEPKVTVTTEERPFDYADIYQRVCRNQNKESMSDKDVGSTLGVSERQIRKARMEGMDTQMADLFACRSGAFPWIVYGWDKWFNPQSFFAADLVDGLVEPEEIEDLYKAEVWK